MSADFKPTPKEYRKLGPFRFWIQKVLPVVFDDSLSYQELLGKVIDYLNTMSENVSNQQENVEALYSAYQSLEDYVNGWLDGYDDDFIALQQDYNQFKVDVNTRVSAFENDITNDFNALEAYVNGYFEGLDVQMEINAKLDEMAENGTFAELFGPVIEAFTEQYSEDVSVLKSQMSQLVAETTTNLSGETITTLSSGSVQVVGGYAHHMFSNLPTGYKVIEVSRLNTSGYYVTDDIQLDEAATTLTVHAAVSASNATTIRLVYSVLEDVQIPELTDIRVGADGTVYPTAGDAVRGQVNDLAEYVDEFCDAEIIHSINFFSGYTEVGSLNNTTGEETTSSAYVRSDYIPIDATNPTLYVLRTTNLWSMRIFFYDENKAFISPNVQLFNANAVVYKNSTSIPQTAKYIRTYRPNTTTGDVAFSYTELSQYEPYHEDETTIVLKDKIIGWDNLNDALKARINLSGKTIAFMGDSIIGNFYDSTGVSAILAEKTGANVINCAFGGSRLAYEYSQYGDASPNATGYVDGATDAQKNQVDQYRFWNTLSGVGIADAIASGDWTAQDNAVANMSSGLAYFSDRLATVKAVDWSSVDFIMWEYGTNDFMTNVALEGNDFFAFDYAYRHIIETILTAYPNIRIITVTPIYRWYQAEGVYTEDSNTYLNADYQNVNHKLTDFVAKAQEISQAYQLPCIDDYYTLGANRFTRLAYFNSTDGTHPNANGRKRIAEHIGSQLISII